MFPFCLLCQFAAVKRLQAKGVALVKDDPNDMKRKRLSSDDITARVERSLAASEGLIFSWQCDSCILVTAKSLAHTEL